MSRWLGASLVLVWTGAGLGGQAALDAAGRLQQAFPAVQLYTEDGHLARVWGAPFGFGESAEVTAQAFVDTHSEVFGVTADELLPGNGFNELYTLPLMYDAASGAYKFTLVYYQQYRDGFPVYDADLRLLVRNEEGYPLVLAASGVRDVGDWHVPAGAVNPQEGAAHAAAAAFAPGLINFGPAEVVVWAGAQAGGQDAHPTQPQLAITFVAEGTSPASAPLKYRFVCDAATGAVLHSENMIIFTDVTGNVKAVATPGKKPDVCNPEFAVNMKYAKVSIGATVAYADALGNFVIPNGGSSPVTVESPMAGLYFYVDNVAGAEETLSMTVTPPGPANFVHNSANTSEAVRAQMNGYVHANIVRDWVLAQDPSYPVISTQTNFLVRVNRTDGYCPGNAWYDGSSLNFCTSSGSYPNTAYSSVVYHEYGHHIVESGGSGQDQYGEGFGDVASVLILDDHWVGYGFFGDCATGLRDAINNIQYPCNGEAHDCAGLLSGAVWDTREELVVTEPVNYLSILSDLMVNSVPLHSGSTITPQVTIDVLTLDDNDGDITNGTPHYNEIATGFGNHNLDAPPLQLLAFSFPTGRPDLVDPAGGDTVRVEVVPLTQEPQPGTGMFYYKVGGGSYTSVPMQVVEPNVYDAVVPAVTCGSTISYYFSAQTTTGQTVLNPSDAPASAYAMRSGYDIIVPFEDAMETDTGWTVGDIGDTATTGIWTRNIPQATPAQPGADHTPAPGVMCWVTDYRAGGSIGDYDVDGGKTTVKTPVFDLSAYADATIGYWRWYSNDEGAAPNADTFRVDISSNGGSTWSNAETVGPAGPETSGGWFYHAFNVASKVPLTNQIQLRFVAEDAGSGSIIEAAVDDFRIEVVDCSGPAFPVGDMNCDATVDFGDINPFVQALSDPAGYEASYPDCDINLGDVNGDGSVGFGDINPFVALLTG